MPGRLQENDFRKEFREFRAANPDKNIGTIFACYVAHKGKDAPTIKEADKHVQNCDWCREYMKEQSEADKRAINKHGWWDGHWD